MIACIDHNRLCEICNEMTLYKYSYYSKGEYKILIINGKKCKKLLYKGSYIFKCVICNNEYRRDR